MQTNNKITYTVAPMTDADCRNHGVQSEDYAPDSLMLATFSDGQAFWFVKCADGQFIGVAIFDKLFTNEAECLRWIRSEMMGDESEVTRSI